MKAVLQMGPLTSNYIASIVKHVSEGEGRKEETVGERLFFKRKQLCM